MPMGSLKSTAIRQVISRRFRVEGFRIEGLSVWG